ncbi:MAG: glycosyltransferase family 2 protein [Longimicrobiales bacterium]|nr:glycosyltransferase family 2 protein [Longimicrobiales bacterium]
MIPLLGVLATLPWLALVLFGRFGIRWPRPLPVVEGAADATGAPESTGEEDARPDTESSAGPTRVSGLPFVSVIVPARNEAANIEACLLHLTASRYPDFEILVVDDRSDDETGALAGAVDPGAARRLEVLDGEPLPEGWLGKPWACWQGYEEASGELLLFTDADTRHAPDLLERSVRGMEEDDAAAVTLMARQLMESFWEKVVQPQLFAMLVMRFSRPDRVLETGRCRDAVANGQFILVKRDAYESIDGHRSVRDEVVEDLRIAQRLCGAGHRLSLREAEDSFATRMYRSLSQIVEGWTKNLAIASRQTVPPWMKPVALPLSVVGGMALWIAPPVALAASAVQGPPSLLAWSAVVVGLSLYFWIGAAHRSRIHPAWGLLYPLGAAVTCFLLIRSWIRGRTVEWKGRVYQVESVS